MKRIITLALMALLLSGCAAESKVIFQNADFTVTRRGREYTLAEASAGNVYSYGLTRRKKAQDISEAANRAELRTSVDTDTLKIESAQATLIVTVKETGAAYLVNLK